MQQVIPYGPTVPTVLPPGLLDAIAQGLVAAGFSGGPSRAPEGLLVSDAATAMAIIQGYAGSAAQLAWAKTNSAGDGLLDQLAVLFAGKIAAGRVYNDGKTYQIDPASQANISAMGSIAASVVNSAPGAAPWPANFTWIAADNSQTPMNAAQMYAFAQNVAGYVSALILNNRALKTAIASASTMKALQAIDITSGWPSNP